MAATKKRDKASRLKKAAARAASVKPAPTTGRFLKLYIVRTKVNPRRKKAKTTSADNGSIWIYNEYTDTTTYYEDGSNYELPCELQDGDVITCYDPENTTEQDEPDLVGFEVYDDPDPGSNDDPVIDYDFDNDELEVDLSVVDAFAENNDPAADPPYTGQAGDGSIGIDG